MFAVDCVVFYIIYSCILLIALCAVDCVVLFDLLDFHVDCIVLFDLLVFAVDCVVSCII